MLNSNVYDFVIIGGGIIGTATAMALQKESDYKILIIETEGKLAAHQTGNNSGVIHSGLFYKPGSLKAKNCIEGRELLFNFCEKHNINCERCGKVVVATTDDELKPLQYLYERGIANGLEGIKKLQKEEINEYEPHVVGLKGLFIPQTGIVDFACVTNTYAQIIKWAGGEIETNCKFLSLSDSLDELLINSTKGEIRTKFLINCSGLYSDRIAKLCGVEPGLQIIPFRGEYYKLIKEKKHLVNNIVYPVADPKFPFLGVHFTRMINGGVEAGPNAVLAFKREGYSHKDFSITDVAKMFLYTGFLKMVMKYYKIGLGEFHRSLSKQAFVKALKKLIPEIEHTDLVIGGAGVRAQALDPSGNLIDDFRIIEAARMIHVLNAPSPAATASISIGNKIALMAKRNYKD